MNRISCVIPVKNRREMVLQAIESALKQKGVDIEVIVVDDGSTDNTLQKVRDNFPRITTVKSASAGPGQARNLGVEASSGDVIMFLDSDDLWYENHCRLLLNAMESGSEAAYGITKNLDILSDSTFLIPQDPEAPSGNCFSALLRWCCMVPSSFAVTRSAFETAGGFQKGLLGEDWFFFLCLARRFPFAFVQEVITLRRLHADNLCRKAFSTSSAGRLIKGLQKTAVDAGCRTEEISRLQKVLELTEKEGETWQSVQDWYMSLKWHGLI